MNAREITVFHNKTIFFYYIYLFVCLFIVVVGIEPRALHLLALATELYLLPSYIF